MPITRLVAGITVAVVVGLVAAAGVVGADASPGPTSRSALPASADGSRVDAALERARAEAAAAIERRQGQLDVLDGRLAGSGQCDPAGTVAGIIGADRAGLAQLGDKIAGDADAATLAADARSIYTDFRVYAVVTPQANVTAACGHVKAAGDELTGALARADHLVEVASSAGEDTSGAIASMADARRQIEAAVAGAQAASDALGTLGPDHGDPDVARSNAQVVEVAHGQLATAGTQLRAAATDLRAVLEDARGW
jgi:hypothetical protein